MEDRRCESCGEANSSDAVFCRTCGAAMGVDAAPTPVDAAPTSVDAVPTPFTPARKRRWPLLVGLAVALAVAAVGALMVIPRDGGTIATFDPSVGIEAGCAAIETHPGELDTGAGHAVPPGVVEYKTNPPNSGNHYGASPVGGVFSQDRQPEIWLHNLEHGHVVILYQPAVVTESVRTALETFTRERKTLVSIQPSSTISEPLVVVAWTKIMRCFQPVDPSRVVNGVSRFYDTQVGHGPEGRLPASETTDG